MNPLSLIPTSWLWPAAAVVGAALLAGLGTQTWRLHTEQAGRATDRASMAEERLLASRATALEEARNRAEETRVRGEQQEKINEKDRQLARAQADRVDADAATGKLRERFAAAFASARQATRDPTVVAGGAAAPASDLPADMFGRVLEIARQYRDAAESAITAGELAEGSYDSLRSTP